MGGPGACLSQVSCVECTDSLRGSPWRRWRVPLCLGKTCREETVRLLQQGAVFLWVQPHHSDRSPGRPSGVQPLPLSPPPSELGDKPPRFLTDPWGLFFNTASESPFHGPSSALETATLLCPRLPFELLVSSVSWGLDQTGPAHAEMSDLRSGSLVIYCCE